MQSLLSLFLSFQLLSFTSPDFTNHIGRAIYLKRCKVCHGTKGDTNPFAAKVLDPPPRNFTSEKSRRELTEERMIHSATNGRPGTAMMPWKGILSPDEILAVIHYIRKKLMKL